MGTYTHEVRRLLGYLISRSGFAEISARYYLGSFGRGGGHPWEISAHELPDNKVIVHYPLNRVRTFYCDVSDPAEPCLGGPGDFGTMTKNLPGDDWFLIEPNGTRYHFRASSGLLDYVEDLNGNRAPQRWSLSLGAIPATITLTV